MQVFFLIITAVPLSLASTLTPSLNLLLEVHAQVGKVLLHEELVIHVAIVVE